MGDVISSHLDESRRQNIAEHTRKLLAEFGKIYEEQYGVALFNSVRYEIEGNGGPQTQLLHRKTPLKDRVIFSGNLFQFVDDTRKWRNRFCVVPHHYGPVLYENKIAYERGLQPRAGINCAGYRVLTSLEQYTELLNNMVPGGKVKAGSAPMKCATQFPIILWHSFCRHYHFCVMTEREQERWSAVFQDCVRHCNNGISEDSRVESAAFTDSVRFFRQARDQYGTWDMLCGNQVQVLSNLVMDDLVPDLKNTIGPRLRGKPQERQRTWLMISDTVYRMVHEQTRVFFEGLEKRCSDKRAEMESQIRTDMDQIIACKEHVSNKIRAAVLPKAELCVRNHVQSHIPSILEALMVPTSQGFSEVRELIFSEATDMNKNLVNEGVQDKLGEHMEKIAQLAYHPVKMQQCYEKMEHLNLEGLQQRFDVGSPSVFKQRAQILMRELTDNAVYTFEQLIHQELNKSEGGENLCRDIQRILERVLKKYDYDSSSVRKRFFQEALLQIIIPFLLKKLAPTCKSELPRYQELIFEELSQFVLVENTYEEVVLQTVMRDIVQAVKDAATQRKHNLFRDSMVLRNSDPNLHLLEDGPPINWTEDYSNNTESSGGRHGRSRQVVSLIQDDDAPEYLESCQESPANENIPEEPESSDVGIIRSMLVKEFDVQVPVSDTAQAPQHGDSAQAPQHGDSAQAPQHGDSAQSPQHGDSAQSPQHGDTAQSPQHGDTAQSPQHGDTAQSPQHGDIAQTLQHALPEEQLTHITQSHTQQVRPGALHAQEEENISVGGLPEDDVDHSHVEQTVSPSTIDESPDRELVENYQRISDHLEQEVHGDQEEEPQHLLTQKLFSTDDQKLIEEQPHDVPENKTANHHDSVVQYVGHKHHPVEEQKQHSSQEKTVHPEILLCQMPQVVATSLATPSEEDTRSEALQSSTSHVVHSTPDDSGFQSPMSEEEEEGEGYRETPVPAQQKKEEVITQF
ncbi:PREDICTED: niban-like protein 1 [Nanorana parkeri]|uniref:niban-like protein 1 n=1 Tax=Nanorana parkeri TaxID=125878 RepID=UPI0008546BB4|nr:PREDICTED: niban-like protein 1 [Nanorana parkeri]